MQNIPTKTDGITTLPAAEFNQIPDEMETSITDTGQTLDIGTLDQVSKAMSIYSAGGTFYTDSGVADTYVLNLIGSKKSPIAYFNGMLVRFLPGNVNTGASTVNVATLGPKSIKLSDGTTDPGAGDIPAGSEINLTFDGTNFRIILVASASGNLPAIGGGDAGKHVVVNQAETAYETITDLHVTSFIVSTGSANAYVVTLAPAITSLVAGQVIHFQANFLSTAAVTVNVNGLGAKDIKVEGFFDLPPFAIKTNQIVKIMYDGTQFQPLDMGAVTGDIINYPAQTKPGYLELDGAITVGNGSSGANNAADQFEGIFRILWDNVDNAEAPVSGGRGGNAAADFAANKTLTLPDYTDASMMAVNSTLSKAGKTAGASTVASSGTVGTSGSTSLSISQMPAHKHFTHTNEILALAGAGVQLTNTEQVAASNISGVNSGNYIMENTATAATVGLSSSTGSGSSHNHSGGSFTGNSTSVLHPVVGVFVLMKI